MGTSTLKSTQITNLDTIPAVRNTTGGNAAGNLRTVTGFVSAVSADDTSSYYKLVRIPTRAYVKYVGIFSKIASAGSGDVNVAYSDATNDGTPPGLQGTIVQIGGPANNKLFGAAQSLVLAGVMTDFTFKGTYLPANQNQMLWEALGLASDPGGFFDIQVNITTAVTTGGVLAARVDYVD